MSGCSCLRGMPRQSLGWEFSSCHEGPSASAAFRSEPPPSPIKAKAKKGTLVKLGVNRMTFPPSFGKSAAVLVKLGEQDRGSLKFELPGFE